MIGYLLAHNGCSKLKDKKKAKIEPYGLSGNACFRPKAGIFMKSKK